MSISATQGVRYGMWFGFALDDEPWDTNANFNWELAEYLTMPSFKNATTSAPPGGAAVGDRYLVGPSGSGAWAGKDGQFTWWNGSGWTFVLPLPGCRVFDEALLTFWTFDGTYWRVESLDRYLSVIDATHTTPPSASFGDTYRIGSPAGAGPWSGKADWLSYWNGLSWVSRQPAPGLRTYNQDTAQFEFYDGSTWAAEP